jgi:hypothetical protein
MLHARLSLFFIAQPDGPLWVIRRHKQAARCCPKGIGSGLAPRQFNVAEVPLAEVDWAVGLKLYL